MLRAIQVLYKFCNYCSKQQEGKLQIHTDTYRYIQIQISRQGGSPNDTGCIWVLGE